MTGETTKNSGIGFLGLLTILFVGLKLTNYIDWSWLWVLAPLWIPTTLIVLICLVYIFCVVYERVKKHK